MQMQQRLLSLWTRLVAQVGTLVLSGIMGLIVWLIAINSINPLVTRVFPESLPIEVRGLAPELMPLQDLSKETVRATLRAPEKNWESLQSRNLQAYIDLTGYTKGAYDVPIEIVPDDKNVHVTEMQRRQLRIQLDEIITKTVDVHVSVMDSTEYGYSWETPVVEPSSLLIRGPAQLVNQVVVAEAPVYLRGATAQVERIQTVQMLNRQDQPVVNVLAEPAAVEVTIPVERWPGRRSVAVRVKLVGLPATGYRLGRVTPEPSNIVLYGNAAALEQVPGFVETAPLSLDGATAEIQVRLELILPDGVNAFEGNAVAIIAEILPIEEGRRVTLRPLLRSVGPGLDATFAPDTVDVILSGPRTSLNALGPDDVYAILDVSGLLPGSYVIKPNVAKPEEIRNEGVLPETVEVLITSLVTPNSTAPITAAITSPLTATAPLTGTPLLTLTEGVTTATMGATMRTTPDVSPAITATQSISVTTVP